MKKKSPRNQGAENKCFFTWILYIGEVHTRENYAEKYDKRDTTTKSTIKIIVAL